MLVDVHRHTPTYWHDRQVNNSLKLRGLFIAIEGLDGAGTTTQTLLLANSLRQQGFEVAATKEPTNGIWGVKIRSILTGELETHPLSLCFGFMADRIEHIQKLAALSITNESLVFISDRYQLSYLAYQQQDTKEDIDWLLVTQQGLPWPDITIFLDVNPDACIERMKATRITAERFENIETLIRIREGYINAIETLTKRGQNIHVINGNRDIDEVHDDIVACVYDLLPLEIKQRNNKTPGKAL